MTEQTEREVLYALWNRVATELGPQWVATNDAQFTAMLDAGAYLDAALMMVPADHFWSITMRGVERGGYHACCLSEGSMVWHEGQTPALALCAAIAAARSDT